MSQTLRAGGLEIVIGEDPLTVHQIVHASAGVEVLGEGLQEFVVRIPSQPSDPVHLREVVEVRSHENLVAFRLRDRSDRFWVNVQIEGTSEGLRFSLRAAGSEPLWMVEWKLEGLDLDEVIVPALGGQALSRAMPADVRISYKYPFWWNAQFALGQLRDREDGIYVRTAEVEPRFKVLRVGKVEESPEKFALGLAFEADAPLDSHEITGSWTLSAYEDSWRTPVDRHRRWLEEVFDLVPYSKHSHFPSWAEDVNFVLEFWGMRNDRGLPAHTYEVIGERLRAFAQKHPPRETLVYLPGYAEGGVDSRIPFYRPSPELGGDDGFERLVDIAHALGYRVMIHTNVLGMTYSHPRYPEFAQHQVVDQWGQRLGWANDLDGDWLPEPYFAYINPGVDVWGDLMEETIGDLIRQFGLDAVFLDQTLLAFNVSRGPNFIEGMRKHIRRLQRSFPDVLFAGEGLHEQVLAELPFVQIHGIDSIGEIHGIEGEASWRRVHPVSTTLFGRHARFMAHLLTRHPSSDAFARQEAAYAELGVVPALVCYRADHSIEGPEVDAMLGRARNLRDKEVDQEAAT